LLFHSKELRARVSDIFLNLSLKAIDISGVSMVVIDGLKCFMDLNLPLQTTFLAEVPLAKSLTGVLKICGQVLPEFL
ncbi:Os11g0149300, partial [Oryza sativa Japonica Group]